MVVRKAEEYAQFAKNVKYLRKAYALSQQDLVDATGKAFGQTYLSSIEKNRKPASQKAVTTIAELFNLTEDELLRTDLIKIVLE